jgi:hypothetical protein
MSSMLFLLLLLVSTNTVLRTTSTHDDNATSRCRRLWLVNGTSSPSAVTPPKKFVPCCPALLSADRRSLWRRLSPPTSLCGQGIGRKRGHWLRVGGCSSIDARLRPRALRVCKVFGPRGKALAGIGGPDCGRGSRPELMDTSFTC